MNEWMNEWYVERRLLRKFRLWVYWVSVVNMKIRWANEKMKGCEGCQIIILEDAPNICKYITSWEEDEYFYIQMEYCYYGSVSSYLEHVMNHLSFIIINNHHS